MLTLSASTMASQMGMSFACGMCGKCYKTAAECVDHIQTHTSQRPFRCLVCWPMFTDATDGQQAGDVTQIAMGNQPLGHDDGASVDKRVDKHDREVSPGVLALRSNASDTGSRGQDIVPASQRLSQQEKSSQQFESESPVRGQSEDLLAVQTQSPEFLKKQPASSSTQSSKSQHEEGHAECADSETMLDTEMRTPATVAHLDSVADTSLHAHTSRRRGLRRRTNSGPAMRKETKHSDDEQNESVGQPAVDGHVLADGRDLKHQVDNSGMQKLVDSGDLPEHTDHEGTEEQPVGDDVLEQGGDEMSDLQGQVGDTRVTSQPDVEQEAAEAPIVTESERQKQMDHLTVSAEGSDGDLDSSPISPAGHATSCRMNQINLDGHQCHNNQEVLSAVLSDSSNDADCVYFDGTVGVLQSSHSADDEDTDGWFNLAAFTGNVDENQPQATTDEKQVIQVETKSKGPNFSNVIQFLKSVSLGAVSPTKSPSQSFEYSGTASAGDAVTESSSSAQTVTISDGARAVPSEASPRKTIHIIQRQGGSQTLATVRSGDRVVVQKTQEPLMSKNKPLRTYERSSKRLPVTSPRKLASGSPARAATIKIVASPGRASQSGTGKQTATVRIIASPNKAGQIAVASTGTGPQKNPPTEYNICVPAFTPSPQQDKTLYHPTKCTEGLTPVSPQPKMIRGEAGFEDSASACSKDSTHPLSVSTHSTAGTTGEQSSASVVDKVSVSDPTGITGTITIDRESASQNSGTLSADVNQSSSSGHREGTEGQGTYHKDQPVAVTQAGGGRVTWQLEGMSEVGERQQGDAGHESGLSLEDLANVCAWIQRVNVEQGAESWQTEIVGQFASHTGQGESGGVLWTVSDHDYAILTHSADTASATQDSETVDEKSALQAETETLSAVLCTRTLHTDTPASHSDMSVAPVSQLNTSSSLLEKQEPRDLQVLASPRHSRQASAHSESDPEKERMLLCVDLYHKKKLPKQATVLATPAARTRSQAKMGGAGVARREGKTRRSRKRTRQQSADGRQTAHSADGVNTVSVSAQDVGGVGLPATTSNDTGLVSQSQESRVNYDLPGADVSVDNAVVRSLSVVLTDISRDHDDSDLNVGVNTDSPSATCSSQDEPSIPTPVCGAITAVVPHSLSLSPAIQAFTTSPVERSEPADTQRLTAQSAAPATRYPKRGETRTTHSPAQRKTGMPTQSFDSSPVLSNTEASGSPTLGQDKEVVRRLTRSQDKRASSKQEDSVDKAGDSSVGDHASDDIADSEGHSLPSTRSKALTPSTKQQSKMSGSSATSRQNSDTQEPSGHSSRPPSEHGVPTAGKSLHKRRLSGARARQALRMAKSVRARGGRYSQISSPAKRKRTESGGQGVLSESVYMAKGRLRASTLFSHPQYYEKKTPELSVPVLDRDWDNEAMAGDESSALPAGSVDVTKVQSGCLSQGPCVVTKTEVQSPAGRDVAKHTSVEQASTVDHVQVERETRAHQATPRNHSPSDSPDKLTVRLPFMSKSLSSARRHVKSTGSVRKVTNSSRGKQLYHSFSSSTVSSENRPSLRQRSATKTSPQQLSCTVNGSGGHSVQSGSVRQAVQSAAGSVLSEIGQTNEVAVDDAEADQSVVCRSKQGPLMESAPDNGTVEGDEGQTHQCEKCGARFSHKLTLLSHMAIHEASLSDYTCDICFRTFTRPYSVKVHRMIHTREALVDCEVCGRTLANPGNLAVHMRIHRDEKPFACQVCPKKFRQQSSLNSHMRTHNKERPFRCEYCGKSYAFLKNLYTHRFTHTGERPYQCTFCDSAFRQVAALKVHLRAHTGEKPFKCDICFTRFTQKSHLKKHLRHIHSPKVTPQEKKEMDQLRPHRCELCGKGFCSPFSAKRHVNGGYCPEDPRFVPVVSKKKVVG